MQNKYENLTPEAIGEIGDTEAINQLQTLIECGTIAERRRAAEATQKAYNKDKPEMKKLVPSLLINLRSDDAHLRLYSLRALNEFDLNEVELKKIDYVAKNDDARYNRVLAESIIKKQRTIPLMQQTVNISKNQPLPEQMEQYRPSSMIKLSNRDKDMYLYEPGNVEKYSANYAYTNHNFVIQNNNGEKDLNNPYFPIICILKNILMRGCPTKMSAFLQEKLGKIHETAIFEEAYTLISTEMPLWLNTIKGDKLNNYFPAITFFEHIIPWYLPEFKFIQQLMLPEVLFEEITLEYNRAFAEQKVDFYLPQARLVVEIDGQNHKRSDSNRLSDKERMDYLKKYGIKTIRIDTVDIKDKTVILAGNMKEIENRLIEYGSMLDDYKKAYENREFDMLKYEIILKSTAIIRFQILILSLLEKNKLNFKDEEWNISVVERDINGFEKLAMEDLFLWITQLAKLNKLEFKQPKVSWKIYDTNNYKYNKGYIDVDFSLFKRWTDENEKEDEKNRIFVRTDYFDKYNYFTVSTHKPIKYHIITEGKNSDIPALKFVLKNVFGFDSFSPGQSAVVINALRGEDTVGLLPTGGGKSLIYQYVALLQPFINFIVTPIKSLMKDQRDNLDKLYISNSNYLNSNQSAEEKEKVQNDFANGKYQFIWISPERFQTEKFREQLQNITEKHVIGMAVIDEVHCLSEWGHDFRTSYLNLAKTIRKYCTDAKVLALTATASVNVLKDILIEFDIDRKNVKTVLSFTRKELTFKVIKDDGSNSYEKEQAITNLLKRLNEEDNIFQLNGTDSKSGIIFTSYINKGNFGCYGLSNYLHNKFNIDVRYYSGESPKMSKNKKPIMKDKEFNIYKDKVQSDFQENKFPLLVATKAFGMGIDKSNVRYTIHYGIPSSVEALYQEGGRAGRDKEPATCYILFSEENFGLSYFDKLFDVRSTVSEIQEALDEIEFQGRDASNNIYFWSNSVTGVEQESKDILQIFNMYAKASSNKSILGTKLSLRKQVLERAIYKLSLLGVVDDWVIESWDDRNPKIMTYFKDYNEQSIEKALVTYIKKYDAEFDLKREKDDKGAVSEYCKIYSNEKMPFLEKVIKILLMWQYENISYYRRQSIKTIYDQCQINYNKPEALKKYMESYFKFSDVSFIFDSLVDNPRAYKNWFNIFFDNKGNLVNNKKLNENKAVLRRFLESIRINTGLNFISGIMQLLTDDYENDDGRARFDMAVGSLNDYEDDERQEILEKTLQLSSYMKDNNKEFLSEVLIKEFPDKTFEIHEKIRDNYSLNQVLKQSNNRIKGKIWGCCNGCN